MKNCRVVQLYASNFNFKPLNSKKFAELGQVVNLLKIFSKLIKLAQTSLVSEAISLSGIIVVDDDRLNQGKSLKTN